MNKFLTSIDFEKSNILEKKATDYYEEGLNYYLHSSNSELDENIIIQFNGSIINQKDTNYIALLKKLYLEYGIDFVKQLEGNFSLSLYDKEQEKLFIVKDKVGTAPLYYHQSDNLIVVGNSLKKFKEVGSLSLTINPNALANYMQFGFVLQPSTIFKECSKLESGSYMMFDLETKESTKHTYWTLESCYANPKIECDEKEILSTAHELLQESISQNMLTKDCAFSLSGGYDSSTLAAIAQSQNEQKVKTFTIGFEQSAINEAPDAKKIAEHIGSEHNEYYCTAKDALRLIPKIATLYDEPFADHAATPTLLTAELLNEQGITRLMAGDGGDEVFATADRVDFFERIENTPSSLKNMLIHSLGKLTPEHIPYLKNHNNFPKKYHKFFQILAAKNISKMIQMKNSLFFEEELKHHIKGYEHIGITTFDKIDFNGYEESVDEVIGTYFKTTMIDGELVKSYTAMQAHNISLATPFLNTKLIEFMAKVPVSIKIKDDIKKYLLKEIIYTYLPKSLMERPKSGFYIPFSEWMREDLKEMLYGQINEQRLKEDNLFNVESILNIRDQFYAGDDTLKYKLWRIFIFQLWHENFRLDY